MKQFTKKQQEYINASIYDDSQNISLDMYLWLKSGVTSIVCKNIQGRFALEFMETASARTNALAIAQDGIDTTNSSAQLFINATTPSTFRIHCNRGEAEELVRLLRKQVVMHNNAIDSSSVTRTNLGEDYNRESFYSTIAECLDNGDELLVDKTKSYKDGDVKYLRLIKLMQEKQQLEEDQNELNRKRASLQAEENELMKY